MRLRIATMILFYVEKNWSCFAYIAPIQLKEERYIRSAKWYQPRQYGANGHLCLTLSLFSFAPVSSGPFCWISATVASHFRHIRRINSWKLSAYFTTISPGPARFPGNASRFVVLDVGTSGQTARVRSGSRLLPEAQNGGFKERRWSSHFTFLSSVSAENAAFYIFCWWWNAGLNAKKITITVAKILWKRAYVQTTLPFCFCPSWSCLSSSLSWISFSSSLQSAFTSCSWFERPKVSGFAWPERKYEGLLQDYAYCSVVPTTPYQYVHLPVCVRALSHGLHCSWEPSHL